MKARKPKDFHEEVRRTENAGLATTAAHIDLQKQRQEQAERERARKKYEQLQSQEPVLIAGNGVQ